MAKTYYVVSADVFGTGDPRAVSVSAELSWERDVARCWKEDGAENVRLRRVTCPKAVKRAQNEAEEVAERLGS